MRLPGTRYQEPGWEQVRKLLGQCSLQVLATIDVGDPANALEDYVEAMAALLARQRHSAPGNVYGDSVAELAAQLVCELRERPSDWMACCAALRAEGARGEAALRKKFNDMYAVLRDKVDADNYQVACGRPCSPNKMYTFRMLDTARGEILALFAGWQERREELAAVLGRPLEAMPIEVKQTRVRAEWVIAWSATREQFGKGPGPLHTRSKRFSSLKQHPETIAAMLDEIAEYEALSANGERDWAQDAQDHGEWLDDLWQVLAASEQAEAAGQCGPDQLLAAPDDSLFEAPEAAADADPAPPHWEALALAQALPARYLAQALAAEDRASWTVKLLSGVPLPVKLSIYLKIFGPRDDTYPDEWLDPATGALPSMQQLAELAELSLPTLRKRRDAAIASLQAAPPAMRRSPWMSLLTTNAN